MGEEDPTEALRRWLHVTFRPDPANVRAQGQLAIPPRILERLGPSHTSTGRDMAQQVSHDEFAPVIIGHQPCETALQITSMWSRISTRRRAYTHLCERSGRTAAYAGLLPHDRNSGPHRRLLTRGNQPANNYTRLPHFQYTQRPSSVACAPEDLQPEPQPWKPRQQRAHEEHVGRRRRNAALWA